MADRDLDSGEEVTRACIRERVDRATGLPSENTPRRWQGHHERLLAVQCEFRTCYWTEKLTVLPAAHIEASVAFASSIPGKSSFASIASFRCRFAAVRSPCLYWAIPRW